MIVVVVSEKQEKKGCSCSWAKSGAVISNNFRADRGGEDEEG